MSELVFNPAKTVALTGHRVLDGTLNKERLKSEILTLINAKYDTFLVGMALGFDTVAFNILESIRKTEKIKIVACIPCPEQSNGFDLYQKKEYERMVESADEKIILRPRYTRICMIKRNEYMVDNSSVLIAYVRENKGGSYKTKNYAIKKGIRVIEV